MIFILYLYTTIAGLMGPLIPWQFDPGGAYVYYEGPAQEWSYDLATAQFTPVLSPDNHDRLIIVVDHQLTPSGLPVARAVQPSCIAEHSALQEER